jgi:nucleotide-binding universal stress UspA family protein
MSTEEDKTVYNQILIPLDGSKTAEKVLPYARSLARRLKLPVELLGVVDVSETRRRIAPEKAEFLDSALENVTRSTEQYLNGIAGSFHDLTVKCTVEKGTPAEVIVDKAASGKDVLISMATHGYSGIKRWLVGSVTEKVLRGTTNTLLLIRATEAAKSDGEAAFSAVIVPLDGSELAETVLPTVAELAKQLKLKVVLFRAYTMPYTALPGELEAYYVVSDEKLMSAMRDEAVTYLTKNAESLKQMGVDEVSIVAEYGLAADEIIGAARQTANSLIAMCTHGRSGVTRWVLGSVTETVVRHSDHPMLVIRAARR